MGGDDEAVRNGDDDCDSGSGFGVVQAISGDTVEEVSSGCLQFDVTVRCRHVKLPEQNSKAEQRQPS